MLTILSVCLFSFLFLQKLHFLYNVCINLGNVLIFSWKEIWTSKMCRKCNPTHIYFTAGHEVIKSISDDFFKCKNPIIPQLQIISGLRFTLQEQIFGMKCINITICYACIRPSIVGCNVAFGCASCNGFWHRAWNQKME